MLEFRPTPDPNDRVHVALAGTPGTRPIFDDDGDGKTDEEPLDGLDNDGDGEVDEDVFLPSQQLAEAVFVDDRPEAVSYGYPTGETHRPLGMPDAQTSEHSHASGVRDASAEMNAEQRAKLGVK